MSGKMIALKAINTNGDAFKQRLQATGAISHAISILEIIVNGADSASLQEKGSEAIATLRAALAR